MKKRYSVTILVLLFGFIFWGLLKGIDTTAPQKAGPDTSLAPEVPAAQKDDLIVLDTPRPGATVTSPLSIRGKARGTWFFEGSFPVVLTDWDGKIIAQGPATAQGQWMTTEYVPFTASLTFVIPPDTAYRRGYLILKKDNPSDDPALDNALELPVTF